MRVRRVFPRDTPRRLAVSYSGDTDSTVRFLKSLGVAALTHTPPSPDYPAPPILLRGLGVKLEIGQTVILDAPARVVPTNELHEHYVTFRELHPDIYPAVTKEQIRQLIELLRSSSLLSAIIHPGFAALLVRLLLVELDHRHGD